MNIDRVYKLAEEIQNQNNDMELGEIVDAEVHGSTIEITYDSKIKKYSLTEKQIDQLM